MMMAVPGTTLAGLARLWFSEPFLDFPIAFFCNYHIISAKWIALSHSPKFVEAILSLSPKFAEVILSVSPQICGIRKAHFRGDGDAP